MNDKKPLTLDDWGQRRPKKNLKTQAREENEVTNEKGLHVEEKFRNCEKDYGDDVQEIGVSYVLIQKNNL